VAEIFQNTYLGAGITEICMDFLQDYQEVEFKMRKISPELLKRTRT
jgi:hypothetical protein